MMTMMLPHDLGGKIQCFGKIPELQELQAWEQQCHSLFAVLASRKILSTDELRRSIEALTAEQYEQFTYYEKWSAAMTSLLLEKGILKEPELRKELFGDDATTTDDPSEPPRFRPGESVRVKNYQTRMEWRRPHIRTPGYVYGCVGEVERVCGIFPDPSFLAFGIHGPFDSVPKARLYRVRFRQNDLWPENDGNDDVVEVELYEHWLESHDSIGRTKAQPDRQHLLDHRQGQDCNHHHHHHHEPRPLVEQRAIDREGPPTPGKQLHDTIYKLLVQKNIVTYDQVQAMSERMDTAGKQLDGATLVVHAWMDDTFRTQLVSDASAAAATLGIQTSNPNAPTILTVIENTDDVHNVVVCTLCSCYPSSLLGIAPSWYKSREYRARVVREPRRVLEEFGWTVTKPRIRVHDSTADHRYLVLPQRPIGTEDWSMDQLRSIITRDCMIGVTEPTATTRS
jgi:nitrile hydratase